MKQITAGVDNLLRDAYLHALQEYTKQHGPLRLRVRFAFIALGSYGRGEMSTHSDIDLGLLISEASSINVLPPQLKGILELMETRIRALGETNDRKDDFAKDHGAHSEIFGNTTTTTTMPARQRNGLRMDTGGMWPLGANSGSVTGTPQTLARNMVPNNAEAPRSMEDKHAISAPTNALLDARYIEMPDSDRSLVDDFYRAQERNLDASYEGSESTTYGKTNRNATAVGLFLKAKTVLEQYDEVVKQQQPAMNVKTDFRQALDWITSGLAHLCNVPKTITGTADRLDALLTEKRIDATLGMAMREAVVWVATKRIASHLAHDDERDVYRTGEASNKVGTSDNKGLEGERSRNGLSSDLEFDAADLKLVKHYHINIVQPLLADITRPEVFVINA